MKIKDTKQDYILNIVARWFVGLVFLFSSFAKAVDPMGTAFKIEEYMTAWSIGSITFEWAVPMAIFLACMLICIEFLIGVMLLTNSFRRFSAWALAIMMFFFTVMTLIDAMTNKVTDCGCFGDAVKLTNWQTFWKNVILDVPTVWIFLTYNVRRKRRFERDGSILLIALAGVLVFSIYNIKHEPVLDFRCWKIGNRMMELKADESPKSYVTYKNRTTGEEQEMLSTELMNKDEAWFDEWEWLSSRVINPNEVMAPGFSMMDMTGEDHATELLPAEDGLVIVTVYSINKLDDKAVSQIKYAHRMADENGIKIVMLTSALPEEVYEWMMKNEINGLDYLFADATAIETMMRGNPGFMYIKNATVIDKGRNVSDLDISEQ